MVEASQSGRLLARNTLINLVGFGVPLLAALYAIPRIIEALGAERFGLLVLAWATVGYMGVLDLGLGQSLTRNLAKAFGDKDEAHARSLTGSALLILAALGVGAGALAFALAPWIVDGLARVPATLRTDALQSFQLLAFLVPATILSSGLIGILEAKHRFDLSNAVSMPMGAFNFLGPLVALQFFPSLFAVIAALALGRLIAIVALVILVNRYAVALPRARLGWSDMKALAQFGGWVTLSRIIVPLMGNFDRFAIATLLSLKALTAYAPPADIATRLLIVPNAMGRVLLPAISAHATPGDPAIGRLFARGMKFCLLAMFPCALVLILYAHEALALWLGPELARDAAPVLQWMMLAVLVNSLGYPPAMLLLGLGRPDYSAKIQLATLPFYIAAVWYLLPIYGVAAAAATWAVRTAIDTAAHCWFAGRVLGGFDAPARRMLGVSAAASALLTAAIFVPDAKLYVLAGGLAATALLGWFMILDKDEKRWLRGLVPAFGAVKR